MSFYIGHGVVIVFQSPWYRTCSVVWWLEYVSLNVRYIVNIYIWMKKAMRLGNQDSRWLCKFWKDLCHTFSKETWNENIYWRKRTALLIDRDRVKMSSASHFVYKLSTYLEYTPFQLNGLIFSLRVDPLFQKKKGSMKQWEKACYGHPINYSNPLFKIICEARLNKGCIN